jgi:hypothetical protein
MGLQGLFAVPSKIFANFDFALTYTLVMKQPFMKTPQLVLATCVGLLLSPLAQGGSLHAFIWNSSTGMQDLGTLGGNTVMPLALMITAKSLATRIWRTMSPPMLLPGQLPVAWST